MKKAALFLSLLILLTGCGKEGPAGAQGIQGSQGSPGQTGPAGPKGADGTVISTVQFCPGFTPTYPSHFPEYGLCISNVMYGVYSMSLTASEPDAPSP
jgi:hypothetical protein